MIALLCGVSPFWRLPREVRDQVYEYMSEDDSWFPDPPWDDPKRGNSGILGQGLPGICRTSRQLFLESTPVYLKTRVVHSLNSHTSHLLNDLLSRVPNEEAFKAITSVRICDWTAEGTIVQLNLIMRMQNLVHLDVNFGFDGIQDGEPMEKYVYNTERYLWMNTGLHYEPQDGRTVAEEIAKMKQDMRDFIEEYGLECMLGLPKLKTFAMGFADNKNKKMYRHRLCHPLWEWAERVMERKWGKREDWGMEYVYTQFPEGYENVGRS